MNFNDTMINGLDLNGTWLNGARVGGNAFHDISPASIESDPAVREYPGAPIFNESIERRPGGSAR